MNKILTLFQEDFVLDFFNKKILPLYPDFKKIEKIKIIPHKNNVWEHTYHVVIEFETSWRLDDLREKYVIDDALIGIAVHGVDSYYPRHFCVTTTRDRKKIIVLLNAKVFNPSEIELKISIPEKLVKKTGTVYKTIWQIYTLTNKNTPKQKAII